jgi:putative flippase GtrA
MALIKPKRSVAVLLTHLRAPGFILALRFGAVGLLNTMVGYFVFAALLLAGLWPGAALVLATVVGLAFNYQTSQCLVFRTGGRLAQFVMLYAGVLALNWVSLRTLHSLGLPELQAQALLTLPLAALSFVGQRLFVFRPDVGRA